MTRAKYCIRGKVKNIWKKRRKRSERRRIEEKEIKARKKSEGK